jgi:hypothetical protein
LFTRKNRRKLFCQIQIKSQLGADFRLSVV